ncbi:MAG: dihydrodipicolinate reductase [Aigarchaeota archaeon]|nr:dihydrodipicolinate reductase [Candidatus Pelearchaeum maunauluense]
MEPQTFVMYGFGEIGRLITALALRQGFRCVGVIDVNPSLVGADVGEVLRIGDMGVKIDGDAERVIEGTKPDVVIHATGSYLDRVYPQLSLCAKLGVDVVSTCETLVYPYYRYPSLAAQLNEEAKKGGARIVGAGINPGFLFDYLPAILTTPCHEIKSISITRSLDASRRRQSFQKKIGIGLSENEWMELMNSGKITGHVGYAESIALLAHLLNLELVNVHEEQKPLLGDDGRALGLQGIAEAITKENIQIRLRFVARLDNEEYDEIRIEGEPSITWRSSGTPGDIATASVILNVAKLIHKTGVGLATLADLPPLTKRHTARK